MMSLLQEQLFGAYEIEVMKIIYLVTGSAGFIGSALTLRLLELGNTVIGIDNHNDYYDKKIKEARLDRHANHPNYIHLRIDLTDKKEIEKVFASYKPRRVVNLAAQAGVRYSIENPMTYINSNIVGFANILEECRNYEIEHLVYASSSSVYGANTSIPFSIKQNVDHPLSLYAASKKSNELLAHTYSHLYGLPTTGLRFLQCMVHGADLTWHYLNLLKLLLRGSQSKYSTMEITSETLHILMM